MERSAIPTGKPIAERRTYHVLALALILVALIFVLLACASVSSASSAKPGRPTAKVPHGVINTTKPTFKWSRAPRAHTYQVRVYKGTRLLLKKTGITRLSWKCSRALPRGVSLTWKVRGRNAGGNGAWSNRLRSTIAPNSLKAITDFRFANPFAVGDIDETRHIVAVIVPAGIDPTALVASFTTNGALVAIADTPQVSGLTPNDFTYPVIYTVTARDGSTQDYVVAVFSLRIGELYQGGIVAYILQPGDPGYATGETHGLIAAMADQSAGTFWSTIGSVSGGGSAIGAAGPGQALGTGRANTAAIVRQTATIDGHYVTCTSGAAYLCHHLVEGGYTDWFLPSKDELNKLYLSRGAVGGYASANYWSSSDHWNAVLYSATSAWSQDFVDGVQGHWGKYFIYRVRAVRAF